MQQAEQLPRIFQANLARLFARVIQPALCDLPIHPEIVTGIAPTMDVFLDRCAQEVDNYTANEANKVYALVLVSLFERQFRMWATLSLVQEPTVNAEREPFLKLFDIVTSSAAVNLGRTSLRQTIKEAFEVSNVVRHGEGRALQRIQEIAPHLIDRSARTYIDLVAQDSPDSEWLHLDRQDVERYAAAAVQYWGLADRQAGSASASNFGLPAG
jgi:hypothetical protein